MSDGDPGAGNLCNFVFDTYVMARSHTMKGLFIKSPFLRTYD